MRGVTDRLFLGNVPAAAGMMMLVVVLLLLIPPHGILSDNEEDYFALAERFVNGSAQPDKTALFDASRHLTLSNATLGSVVSAIGYGPAQVVTRLLAVAGFALTLPALSKLFGLSALDTALAVMITALIGQDIIGGEWLFGGYEAKVAAYVLVLAALRRVLICPQLNVAIVLFAMATYFHFLVGGFWFLAAMALRLLEAPRDFRHAAAATGMYALLIAPLAGVIAWSRLAETGAIGATDVPSPDVIYSIIREPHHQSPFLSWRYFRDQWLPGYVLAGPMLLASLWIANRGNSRQIRILARWLAGLLAYLFVVLVPKFLDRDTGVLGKFYLFRPSALILLLWLLLATAFVVAALEKRAWLLRASLLGLIGPVFLYTHASQLLRTVADSEATEQQKRPLIEAMTRTVPAGEMVLIDPEEEVLMLDFERRTGLPTFVMWKFAPTNDADLVRWYRRIELRRMLFDRGCGIGTPAAYLLTTPSRAARLAGCGPEVLRVGPWVVLHHQP